MFSRSLIDRFAQKLQSMREAKATVHNSGSCEGTNHAQKLKCPNEIPMRLPYCQRQEAEPPSKLEDLTNRTTDNGSTVIVIQESDQDIQEFKSPSLIRSPQKKEQNNKISIEQNKLQVRKTLIKFNRHQDVIKQDRVQQKVQKKEITKNFLRFQNILAEKNMKGETDRQIITRSNVYENSNTLPYVYMMDNLVSLYLCHRIPGSLIKIYIKQLSTGYRIPFNKLLIFFGIEAILAQFYSTHDINTKFIEKYIHSELEEIFSQFIARVNISNWYMISRIVKGVANRFKIQLFSENQLTTMFNKRRKFFRQSNVNVEKILAVARSRDISSFDLNEQPTQNQMRQIGFYGQKVKQYVKNHWYRLQQLQFRDTDEQQIIQTSEREGISSNLAYYKKHIEQSTQKQKQKPKENQKKNSKRKNRKKPLKQDIISSKAQDYQCINYEVSIIKSDTKGKNIPIITQQQHLQQSQQPHIQHNIQHNIQSQNYQYSFQNKIQDQSFVKVQSQSQKSRKSRKSYIKKQKYKQKCRQKQGYIFNQNSDQKQKEQEVSLFVEQFLACKKKKKYRNLDYLLAQAKNQIDQQQMSTFTKIKSTIAKKSRKQIKAPTKYYKDQNFSQIIEWLEKNQLSQGSQKTQRQKLSKKRSQKYKSSTFQSLDEQSLIKMDQILFRLLERKPDSTIKIILLQVSKILEEQMEIPKKFHHKISQMWLQRFRNKHYQ